MAEGRIRPVALALVFRGEEILVEEGLDQVKGLSFSRLLGGTIEFGERGEEAIVRELREEIGAEADVVARVATIENLFTYEGELGHEIVLVYECTLRDPSFYERDAWEAPEPALNTTHQVAWKHPDRFTRGHEILYPEEVLARATARGSRSRGTSGPRLLP
jgi:8-oxo-dGTP pyrophosphatase MutT (NUDIX family)